MTQQPADNSSIPLEFNHFTSILSALVPGFTGSALYDLGGNNLWMSPEFAESVEDEVRLFLEERKTDLASGAVGELEPKCLSGDILLFSHILFNHLREPTGIFILLIQPEYGMKADALKKKMAPAVKAIAAILSEGYQLNTELNSMANELIEHYEELNLVFGATEQENRFSAIRATLQKLVKDCALNMHASYSAIILPDKNIHINHVGDTQAFENITLIDTQLNHLSSWTRQTNRSLVLNDEKDPAWDELNIELPYKLLSHPVYDQAGSTLGIIVSLKEKNAEDFVNIDKNLLMVIADKVSKTIQSNYDTLTGLMNLETFKYHLDNIPSSKNLIDPKTHTVLYVDMDQMKMINEILSHQAGDEVLRTVGELIQKLIRDQDIVARIGGDIFGILLYNCPPERGLIISRRIIDEIANLKILWNQKNIPITACIGLASSNIDALNILSTLNDAEIACSIAKEEGKNKIRFFKIGDVDHTSRKDEMRWANVVQDSLNKNNFVLYCQKIQALTKEGAPLFYEILLRALDDKGEIVEPSKFISAAERYKLMPSVDRMVIINTLGVLEKFWENLQHKEVKWSINLSGQSFRDETFLDFIISRLQNSKIPSSCICFEITETAAIGNLIAAQNLIQSLRNIGCIIALDDFGSGLSSFNYLKNLHIDYLKIDGSIIKDIVENQVARTMVKAIKDIAHALQLITIGEYVENELIAEQLSRLGVDYAQGYFFGRPVPLENEIKNIIAVQNTGEEGSSL